MAPMTSFKVIDSADGLVASFRLRHDVYSALGYCQRFTCGLELDEHDPCAIPFGAFVDGRLVGTVRLVTRAPLRRHAGLVAAIVEAMADPILAARAARPRRALPSIETPEIAACLRAGNPRRRPVVELSRIIVHPDRRGGGSARGLMELGLAHALLEQDPLIIGACLPEHVAFHERYGFARLPGTEDAQSGLVGQVATTILCDPLLLPEPTRRNVRALRARLTGGPEVQVA
jgi:hypothetical protein